jgi:hypothetical protein
MFNLETARIENAIQKAKALHPKVKMVHFGEYAVSGSKGNEYTVKCYRDGQEKIVDCSCPTRDDIACKHGMAAVLLHVHVATMRLVA